MEFDSKQLEQEEEGEFPVNKLLGRGWDPY